MFTPCTELCRNVIAAARFTTRSALRCSLDCVSSSATSAEDSPRTCSIVVSSPDTSGYSLSTISLSSAALPSQPSSPYTHFAYSCTSGISSPCTRNLYSFVTYITDMSSLQPSHTGSIPFTSNTWIMPSITHGCPLNW